MWRTAILAGAVLATVLPASQGDTTSAPAGAGDGSRAREFAAAPIVERTSDAFQVTVRVSRPLPTKEGVDLGGLALPATTGEHHGLRRLTSTTDCYQQDLFQTDEEAESLMPGSAPGVGDRAEVRLATGTAKRISAAATVETATDWSDRHDKRLADRLGCHRPAQVRRCGGAFRVMDMTIRLDRVSGGGSCGTGRRVFQSVKDVPWARSCKPRLCLSEVQSHAGFRCHLVFAGEHAWRLVCQRGRADVVGSVAY